MAYRPPQVILEEMAELQKEIDQIDAEEFDTSEMLDRINSLHGPPTPREFWLFIFLLSMMTLTMIVWVFYQAKAIHNCQLSPDTCQQAFVETL